MKGVVHLAARVFGTPPPANAPRAERLRYVRRFYVRPLPLSVPVYVFALTAADRTWQYVVLLVGALIWLQGLISLTVRIRREE